MDNKKNGIPKLRFPGFTGAWEQRKLGEEFEKVNERNNGEFGKDRWISVAKMYFQDPDKVTSNNIDTRTYVMRFGDIAFEGHPNNEFKFGRFVANDIGDGVVSELFPIYRHIRDYDNNYWKYAIHLERIMGPIFAKSITSSGNSSNKLAPKDLLRQSIYLPYLDEQKKIGAFLTKLDSFIALHQRKLEHLKEQKKGLLQKMFPKNGEVVPEVRFPGFTDDWEQRKLGEVATFINGRAYKQNELLDSGKYKVLRVGNFYTNDSWYYSNLELADKYYIDKGDLVYTWSATFGPHIWDGEKVIYHYHIWKIELSEFLDRDFTLQILEADKAKLLANTNGSTMIHVTKKDMESKIISLPNIEEQKQIGSYLMKFDSLIALHQRKLEHLKLMKKGLLQQMFV